MNSVHGQVNPHDAAGHQARREARQHHRQRSLHEEQLSGFPALRGRGYRDRRRRRSHAAVADRSREAPDHGRPQAHVRRSRRKTCDRSPAGHAGAARSGHIGMGRQPDQHRAHVRRNLGADQGRRLVARFELPVRQPLAAAPVGFQQALSLHRHAKAATASATARRHRSAPRSPIASTAASPSASRTTAT